VPSALIIEGFMGPEKDGRALRGKVSTSCYSLYACFAPLRMSPSAAAVWVLNSTCLFEGPATADAVSEPLCALLLQTLLNIHLCLYDAYGMTMVEAAAFGAPSVVNVGPGGAV